MTTIILGDEEQNGIGPAALETIELPTVRTKVDTFADENRPTRNFGDRAKLRLRGPGFLGAGECHAFIFFARPFPIGATILEARLKVYLAGAWSGDQTITAKRITQTWKEGRLTWDKQPNVSATNAAIANVVDGAAGQEVTFDVAAMLGDVSAGNSWFGIRLELDDDADRRLWSSDNPAGERRPVLELDWVVPPLAPTDIAPSGDRVVSIPNPVVTWRFKDPENEAQSASQVQLSTTEDFAVVEYDSGKVANTEAEWDLATTAFAGVPDGESRFVRVKVWDEGDLASEWSDVEGFTRHTKGELTIINPAAAPNDFVEETTPPLDWTFTGRDQVRARVDLIRLDDIETPWSRLTRWRVEEETSVTVPRNMLKSGRTYRVIVRVWDDFDRQAMPNDPAYVEASRDFTYERAGTPAPVTALTAETFKGSPRIRFEWERATQPDYFCIRVDGEEIMQRVDPDDASAEASLRTNLATNPRARWSLDNWVELNGAALPAGFVRQAPLPVTDGLPADVDTGFLITGGDSADVALPFAAEAGKTYTVSVYFMVVDVLVGSIEFAVAPPGGGPWIGQTQVADGDVAFVRRTITFTATADGTHRLVVDTPIDTKEVYWSAILIEEGEVAGDYGDGDFDGWHWDGVEHMSESFLASTIYALDFWRAVGGAPHLYEVEAVVVDGGKMKHSAGNATVEAETYVSGVWLVDDDPAETLAVQFMDRQQSSFVIGESGETFHLPGSRRPVRLTDSMRGYEGSIGGILGSSADKDVFLDLKGRMKTLRLIQSTLNIPVELGDVGGPSPRTAPGGRYDASVEVSQVGEFPMRVAGD